MVERACERYLRMLDLAEEPGNEFYFSPAHVADYCDFVEKLRHVESGLWQRTQVDDDGSVNEFIILEPWQIWIECAIQGFRRRLTGERLVMRALELAPRKNGKTLRLAPAALFDLACAGQLGAQVPIAAATGKQADDTLYGVLLKFLSRNEEFVEAFKITWTNDEIRCGDGRIWKLTSQGERQDGLNPSLAVFEEGHAGAASVYKVIKSAFGARPNALLRMITTAGYRPEGPAFELLNEAKLILLGGQEDYSFFAAVYALDEEDYLNPETKAIDWDRLLTDERLIEKTNPMYRVSLDPAIILEARREAKRRPDQRGEFARTRFNIWTGQGQALIPLDMWNACKGRIQLDDLIGHPCWMGVDLAERLDMCAIALIFELPGDVLAVFAKFFLPELSPTATDPETSDLIAVWAEDGFLTMTEGALADHDRVREEVDIFCDVFDVQAIACDPKQAHNTIKILWDGQRPVVVYPNNAVTMTGPTDDVLARVVAKKLTHDGNPVLAWNASNVHGDRRGNGSVVPRKEKDNSKRKIDGFVAAVMANGARLHPEHTKRPDREENGVIDPFLARGGRLLGFEDSMNG